MAAMGGLLEFDSFCYFFTHKTGTIVSLIILMLMGVYRSMEELLNAIQKFQHSFDDSAPKVAVIFTDDLEPTISIVLAIFLFIGTIKENINFIFAGVIYCCTFLIRNGFFLIILALKHSLDENPFSQGIEQTMQVAVTIVIQLFLLVNIFNYYNELKKKKTCSLYKQTTSSII